MKNFGRNRVTIYNIVSFIVSNKLIGTVVWLLVHIYALLCPVFQYFVFLMLAILNLPSQHNNQSHITHQLPMCHVVCHQPIANSTSPLSF